MGRSRSYAREDYSNQNMVENSWIHNTLHREEIDALGTYGINRADYRGPSKANLSSDDDDSYDQMRKDFIKAANNDYSTRRALEVAALNGNEDALKLAEGGMGSVEKVIQGYRLMQDFHKEDGNSDKYGSYKDTHGVSYNRVKNDRDKLNQSVDDRIEAASFKDQQEGFEYEGPDKEISPEMQQAKERAAAFKAGSTGSTEDGSNPYGPKKSAFSDAATAVYGANQGGGDDQQAQSSLVADSADKSQSYLDAQKEKMKQERNFKGDF